MFIKPNSGWRYLGKSLIPARLCSRRTRWFSKVLELVKLPYVIAFTLTIPIAESEEDDEGEEAEDSGNDDDVWSQYLHVIQVLKTNSI